MEIQAHLQLADHAAAVGGRLYINGGGWNTRPPQPVPWALALELKVPWHDNNRKLEFQLELLDADGGPVEAKTPDGLQPVAINGEMKLTAGPMAKPGSQIVGLAAVILPPLPLRAAETFEWKLTLDGHTRDEWRATFSTLELPAQGRRAVG